MELANLVVHGMAAGLATSLVLRMIWAAVAARYPSDRWRRSGAVTETLYVGAHGLAGAALALVFWLSWGLAALVSVPWWVRGISFGLVNAAPLMLPLLVIAISLRRESPMLYVLLLTEALATSLACGLACSWHWAHAPPF